MAKTTPDYISQDEVIRMIEEAPFMSIRIRVSDGCPPTETLETFAHEPKSFGPRDEIFDHVMGCSPCFRIVAPRRKLRFEPKRRRI